MELDVLAKELECKSCGASLQLLNCFRETVSGWGVSFTSPAATVTVER